MFLCEYLWMLPAQVVKCNPPTLSARESQLLQVYSVVTVLLSERLPLSLLF